MDNKQTVVLTDEDIRKAKSYVNIADKESFVQHCAARCIDRLSVQAENDGNVMPLPPMYKENGFNKARYIMTALIKLYLGFDTATADDDELLMNNIEYDYWAEAHVLNQIERMKFKGDAALRDKCFDLMLDYRELERRLNAEIYGLIQVMNDPIQRFIAASSLSVTPQNLQAALSELNGLQTEFDELAKKTTAKSE